MNRYVRECRICHQQYQRKNTYIFTCRNCNIESGKIENVYPRTYYTNRKVVFERDNYECQCCLTTKNIIAHHIDCNKLNNSTSNLITLCNQCHLSLHRKYNKYILRKSNIYKLFPKKFSFGVFGKRLIYN